MPGFSLVDYSDEFKVGVAEGHDPVGGTPARVTAALYRGETMVLFHLPRSGFQVDHGNEYVIDFHSSKGSPSERVQGSGRRDDAPILPFRFRFRARWLVPLRLESDRTDADR